MWKTATVAFVAAFAGAFAGLTVAGTIPLLNPQQLQVPATGVDLNGIINQVNKNAVLTGPGGTAGTPGGGTAAGAFSVNQTLGAGVDGIHVVGTGTGGVPTAVGTPTTGPTIAAIGSDPNINLALLPQGNGVVQFAGASSWVSQPSLTTCPGYSATSIGRGSGGPAMGTAPSVGLLAPAATVTGYLVVLDYLGKPHAIPTC